MAVTKRTRFEVLKRDNHTCQYCGEQAPNVTLHVDHVIPVSLGGNDNPSNLVAACKDCNTGKGSTTPGAAKVAEVNAQALAYSQALRENLAQITATYSGIRKVKKDLDHAWEYLAHDCGWNTPPPKDNNWGTTLHKWLKLGLTPDYIEHAMEIALGRDHLHYKDVYRYFCGVIYRTLDDAHEQTQSDNPPEPKECGHCHYCLLPEEREDGDTCMIFYEVVPGDESPACKTCGVLGCPYELGIQDGMQHEWSANYDAIMHYRSCTEVRRG